MQYLQGVVESKNIFIKSKGKKKKKNDIFSAIFEKIKNEKNKLIEKKKQNHLYKGVSGHNYFFVVSKEPESYKKTSNFKHSIKNKDKEHKKEVEELLVEKNMPLYMDSDSYQVKKEEKRIPKQIFEKNILNHNEISFIAGDGSVKKNSGAEKFLKEISFNFEESPKKIDKKTISIKQEIIHEKQKTNKEKNIHTEKQIKENIFFNRNTPVSDKKIAVKKTDFVIPHQHLNVMSKKQKYEVSTPTFPNFTSEHPQKTDKPNEKSFVEKNIHLKKDEGLNTKKTVKNVYIPEKKELKEYKSAPKEKSKKEEIISSTKQENKYEIFKNLFQIEFHKEKVARAKSPKDIKKITKISKKINEKPSTTKQAFKKESVSHKKSAEISEERKDYQIQDTSNIGILKHTEDKKDISQKTEKVSVEKEITPQERTFTLENYHSDENFNSHSDSNKENINNLNENPIEDKGKNSFGKVFTLSLKFNDTNIVAKLKNNTLNLSVFLSSSSISNINMLKSEITNILRETGFDNFNLKIETKGKKIYYSNNYQKREKREIDVKV